MPRIFTYISFVLILFPGLSLYSQIQSPPSDSSVMAPDTIWAPQDTTWVVADSVITLKDSVKYKTLEKYSHKFRLTKFLYRLIFRPVSKPVVQLPEQNVYSNGNLKAEGRIIRNISIDVLDPFGFSIHDTSRSPGGFIQKAGNELHVKTRSIIISNLLLFRQNDRYDSLDVYESERLIRSQKYIHDVRIYTMPSSTDKDSVDIYIRAMDIWSMVPALSPSGSVPSFGLTDFNFAGFGSMMQANVQRHKALNDYVARLSYNIPNIRNSYISLNLQYALSDNIGLLDSMQYSYSFFSPISVNPHYTFSSNRNLLRSVELSRTFYTPGTKWAGGLFIGQMITPLSYLENDTLKRLPARTNIQDLWGARSWQIARRSPDGAVTNLIFSVRMLRTYYPRIEKVINPADFSTRENLYFASVGITSRKYIRDRYIFNYGKIEDVPAGKMFGITVGLDDVRRTNRLYLGIQAAWGDYHPAGYISTHLEFGTLKGPTGFQQGVIAGRINYFTPLLSVGNWKIRQFASPSFTFGIRRLPTDNLTLNSLMKGFEKLQQPAIHMYVMSLQTQSYAPWNLAGFRFGPYFFTSFGILGNAERGFRDSKIYSLLGLGILVKNDYLTLNTFQVSFTFYPFMPGRGFNVIRPNAYQTDDYMFRTFEISKPEVVEYR